NQNLRILLENIQIASNEILRRRGAYLPFVTAGAGASLNKYSYYTIEGADNLENTYPGGGSFPVPLPDFLLSADVNWQIDIWRQLRNSRDAAGLRLLASRDGRNFIVTRLVAEIAQNYYALMALDKQLETLDQTITLQEQSLEIAKARKAAARDTELAVQRFQAEVRKNQSQKLIIYQQIIETENRINFLCGRFPQPVQRTSQMFLDLQLHQLNVGIPSQLLLNRPDIRASERELAASGLDIRVARASFFPRFMISSGVGYEAFNTQFLIMTPASLIYNVAGNLVAPLINKTAIKAEFMTANARQLQAMYDYQRSVISAVTEVINSVAKVQNYSTSIELKKQQLESLETAVSVATNLFQSARVEYMDVLFAQRDRNDARLVLIDTKREQLQAIVNAYQALGGGWQINLWQNELPLPAEEQVLPGGEPLPAPLPPARFQN
ncbi:MAG TPA: TolC family protein, partial [Pirellulales bacterium]|nr:TolC family protein [Pirellulales bacterium]